MFLTLLRIVVICFWIADNRQEWRIEESIVAVCFFGREQKGKKGEVVKVKIAKEIIKIKSIIRGSRSKVQDSR